jgi:hypothetical protein
MTTPIHSRGSSRATSRLSRGVYFTIDPSGSDVDLASSIELINITSFVFAHQAVKEKSTLIFAPSLGSMVVVQL